MKMVKRKRVIPLHPSNADHASTSEHSQAEYNSVTQWDIQTIKSNLRWTTHAMASSHELTATPEFDLTAYQHSILVEHQSNEMQLALEQTEYSTLNSCREKETGPLNKCMHS